VALVQPGAAAGLSPDMARYFFHLLGTIRWADEEGREFPDLPTARRWAVDRMVALETREDGAARSLSIQVTSADGVTLFAVSPGAPPPSLFRLH